MTAFCAIAIAIVVVGVVHRLRCALRFYHTNISVIINAIKMKKYVVNFMCCLLFIFLANINVFAATNFARESLLLLSAFTSLRVIYNILCYLCMCRLHLQLPHSVFPLPPSAVFALLVNNSHAREKFMTLTK